MADEVLGHGRIVVEVQQNVDRELRKAEADFDRAMARLDRKEAEITLDVDASRFHDKLRKAQADLEKWQKAKADATLGVDTKQANAGIANATQRLKRYEAENVKLYNKITQLDEDRTKAAETLANKREAGERKVNNAVARDAEATARKIAIAEAKAARERTAANDKAARDAERIRNREAAEAERAQARITKAANKEINLRIREAVREADAVVRLNDRAAAQREKREDDVYRNMQKSIRLQEERQRLNQQASKIFQTPLERQKVAIGLEMNNADLAKVNAELAAIGHPPPHVSIDIDQSGVASLSKFVDAVTNTTVRLGPFTTTIAGAARALALLGPVIIGVVGALGSVVSVVGAASVGFAGLAAGGLGAFGLVLGSTALLIPPMLGDLKNLNTLQNAYQREALKSGENSKKAKEALKTYNEALDRAPKSTRTAIKGFGEIKDAWKDLAKQSEPEFMNTINAGVDSVKGLIKDLGPEVTQSFSLVSKGVRGIFKGLNSDTAKNIFKDLFDAGQASMPAFGRGLGNLAEAAGRIAAAFAKIALPKAGAGFETWSKGILNFAKDGDKVTNMVKTTTAALSSLGHFLQGATKFLIAFFGQGVEPGIGLLDDLTSGLDGFTKSINNNPKGLQDFFGNSVQTAEKLYSAISPLAQAFMEWSTLMRPISDAALEVLGAILKLSNAIFGLKATKDILVGAFAIFVAGSLLGKVLGLGKALFVLRDAMLAVGATKFMTGAGFAAFNALLAGFPAKIRAIKTASKAAQEAQAVSTLMPVGRQVEKKGIQTAERVGISVAETAGISAAGSKAATATKEISTMRAGVAALGGALGIASEAGAVAATGGLALLAGAAVYGGYKLLTMKSAADKLKESLNQTKDSAKGIADEIPVYNASQTNASVANKGYKSAVGAVDASQTRLDRLKPGTDKYNAELAVLNERLQVRAQRENEVTAAMTKSAAETVKLTAMQMGQFKANNDTAKALDNQKEKQDRYNQAVDMYGKNSAEARRAQLELTQAMELSGKAKDAQSKIDAQVEHAQNALAASSLNNARIMRGLIPLTDQAAQSLGKLARTKVPGAQKLSATIATKYEDPKDVQQVSQRANAALKNGVKASIVTNVIVNSKNAEQALRRINALAINPKKLEVTESGSAKVIARVEAIIGRKLTRKEQKIVEQGSGAVLQMLGRILGIKIPVKRTSVQIEAAAALASISSVVARMGQLQNKSVYIDTYYRTHGNATPGGQTGTGKGGASRNGATGGVSIGRSFAAGGPSNSLGYTPANKPQLPGIINWAADTASTTKKTNGGKYSRPTYLVGEENRDEYVIATNPAYKKRNVGFLAQAAMQLGFDITPKSKESLAQNGKQVRNNVNQYGGIIAAAAGIANSDVTTGYTPSFDVSKGPASPGKTPKKIKRDAKTFRTKRTKALKSGRSWANYITGLETQQGDLEREITLRSSTVQEPSSLTKEDGRIIIDVPNADGKGTHKEDLGPKLVPDTEAINIYKVGLASVQEAMNALVQVVQAIIVGIPKAIQAITVEDAYRRSNITAIKDAIGRDETIIKNHKKGKVSKEDKKIIANAQSRLTDNNSRLKHERDQRDVIKTDRSTLTDEMKEAGFDLREAKISAASNFSDLMGVDKKATTEATDNNQGLIDDALRGAAESADPAFNDPSSGNGSGSGADSGPTLQQQTGLADTERANILKQYGGNMGAVTGAGIASALMGGMQTNLAGSNPIAAIGSAMAGAASAAMTTGAGGGVTSAMTTGSAFSAPAATPFTGGAVGGGTMDASKTVNIVNNFSEPPADPHTWSAGVGFEANSLV